MKILSCTLYLALLLSCTEQEPEENLAVKVSDNKELATIDSTVFVETDKATIDHQKPSLTDSTYVDYWCSSEILKNTEENIDNLNIVIVADFMATLHSSCSDNIEYSEWSNELLFKVLQRRPGLFAQILSKNSSLDTDYIVYELTNPLLDVINLNQVIDTIQAGDGLSPSTKERVIKALETAIAGG
ncbi:MAG: hypothetical protein JKX76_03350 [Colwellia sp.]|nr:hypothetical protein [Colwellia sp.]